MPPAPYKTYFGGKAASGVPQTIINRVPPHRVKIIGCLGNCAVTRYMRPADVNILNDLNANVVALWDGWHHNFGGYSLLEWDYLNRDITDLLRSYIATYYDAPDTVTAASHFCWVLAKDKPPWPPSHFPAIFAGIIREGTSSSNPQSSYPHHRALCRI